jgi:hypothetical protein
MNVVQDPFVIEPGDAFQTKCYYDSQNERFGMASQDEMCVAFLYCKCSQLCHVCFVVCLPLMRLTNQLIPFPVLRLPKGGASIPIPIHVWR